MRRILPFVILTTLTLLPGCIAIGGSETNHRPTTGQELIDLKSALDRGIITQAEYDQKKTQILNRT